MVSPCFSMVSPRFSWEPGATSRASPLHGLRSQGTRGHERASPALGHKWGPWQLESRLPMSFNVFYLYTHLILNDFDISWNVLIVISRQTCWDIPMSWPREHCFAVSNLSCLSTVIREVTSSNIHPMPLLEVCLAVQLKSRLASILKAPMSCGCTRWRYLSTSHHVHDM